MTESSETKTLNKSPARRAVRWATRLAILLVAVFAGGCIMLYSVQERMIFPGAATQGSASAQVRETGGTQLVRLTLPDATPVVARFDPTPVADAARAPTILLFYGNGQCAASTGGVIYLLQQVGCNVLTLDYPGYGMSGGKPSETAFYAAADAAWAQLQSRTDIDTGRLYIMGWSLGGAVAIDLASRTTPRGLITISAFTSAVEMGKLTAPWAPVSLILKHRFMSIDKIGKVRSPSLIVHGQLDTMIPSRMSNQLAAKVTTHATLLTLPESDHNNIFDVDGERIGRAIAEFIARTEKP